MDFIASSITVFFDHKLFCQNHQITLIAWKRKTPCIASRIASIPRKEKDKLERPPLILAPGKFS